MTAIRKLLSCCSLSDLKEVVCKTLIIDKLATVLNLRDEDVLIYFLKLEALWTLTNLAAYEDDIVGKMLV
jgi:hypothetical protein